ncbi:MAG: hypothetical protein GQ523_05240 [Methanophagales archaeon]|nr:hypothetical protein [Methanophagales archaeon]
MEETIVDTDGRIEIPESIRKKWEIKEGTVISIEEKDSEILLKLKKRVSLKDLCGLSPKRTGKPKWATAEEIKSIWGQIQMFCLIV